MKGSFYRIYQLVDDPEGTIALYSNKGQIFIYELRDRPGKSLDNRVLAALVFQKKSFMDLVVEAAARKQLQRIGVTCPVPYLVIEGKRAEVNLR